MVEQTTMNQARFDCKKAVTASEVAVVIVQQLKTALACIDFGADSFNRLGVPLEI